MKQTLCFLAVLILCRIVSADDANLVRGGGNCTIIHHTGFALCYNERFEQAAWVAYELTRREVQTHKVSRQKMQFEPDDDVPTGSATKDDYRNSGYDKGHLAPAADMRWSAKAMRECFRLSNISPQVHAFNAGVWEDLEKAVRGEAERLDTVEVVTGPLLRDGLPTIGEHHVAVPEFFFKVLLYTSPTFTQAIGFIIPNQKSLLPFTAYAVPVDSVESVTGLNFFGQLDPQLRAEVESRTDVGWWFPQTETRRTRNKR
jgi:endonuclease G, mitochondrial